MKRALSFSWFSICNSIFPSIHRPRCWSTCYYYYKRMESNNIPNPFGKLLSPIQLSRFGAFPFPYFISFGLMWFVLGHQMALKSKRILCKFFSRQIDCPPPKGAGRYTQSFFVNLPFQMSVKIFCFIHYVMCFSERISSFRKW